MLAHLYAPWSLEWSFQGCIRPRTVDGRPEGLRLAQSSWKLLINPLALCRLHSMTKVEFHHLLSICFIRLQNDNYKPSPKVTLRTHWSKSSCIPNTYTNILQHKYMSCVTLFTQMNAITLTSSIVKGQTQSPLTNSSLAAINFIISDLSMLNNLFTSLDIFVHNWDSICVFKITAKSCLYNQYKEM